MDSATLILLGALILSVVAGPAIGFAFARRRLAAKDRARADRSARVSDLDDSLRHLSGGGAPTSATSAPAPRQPASPAPAPRPVAPSPAGFDGNLAVGPSQRPAHPLASRRFDFEPPVFADAPAQAPPRPPAESTPPTAASTPPAAESTSPTAASTPPAAEPTPPTAPSTPPAAEPTPPTVALTPPAAESTPPTAASTPRTAESTPSTAAWAPPTAASTPPAAESTPPNVASAPRPTSPTAAPPEEMAPYDRPIRTRPQAIPTGTAAANAPNPSSPTDSPTFRPISDIVDEAITSRLSWLERLSAGRLLTLHRLGYDDPVKIANLRSTEVVRLARALQVPEDEILEEWMPAARRELGIRMASGPSTDLA